MPEQKIGRVVGLASSALHDKTDPLNPLNRRISIVVLKKNVAEHIGLDAVNQEPIKSDKSVNKSQLDNIDFW